MRGYGFAGLRTDAVAALSLVVLLVPQAMAYAQLAGLPPRVGLFAAAAPAVAYALLGTSRYLSVGPVALVSLMVAETVGDVADALAREPTEVALALAATTGCILLLLGLFRLGFMVHFISRPVLAGFAAAAAVLIATSQLGHLLGIAMPRAGFLGTVAGLGERWEQVQGATAAVAGGSLLILWGCAGPLDRLLLRLGVSPARRRALDRAAPLLVAAGATAAVAFLGLQEHGVSTVGAVSAGLPPLALPPFELALWRAVLPGGAAIALVAYVTAMAVARSLGGRRREHVDPDRELLALGAANLVASATGGYPVGASFSRSAVTFETGARTAFAAALAGVLAVAAALLLDPLLRLLPEAALAAIIVSAVLGLIDLGAARRAWRVSRADGMSLALTFLSVLAFGVTIGIGLGALMGVLVYLWRTSQPRIVIQGPVPREGTYRSESHARVEPLEDPVLVLRVDQDLYFANVSHVQQHALEAIAARSNGDDLVGLVLDFRGVNELDASAAEMLEGLLEDLHEAGIAVALAEVKQPVEDRLARAGLGRAVPPKGETTEERTGAATSEEEEASAGARPDAAEQGPVAGERTPASGGPRVVVGIYLTSAEAVAALASGGASRDHPE